MRGLPAVLRAVPAFVRGSVPAFFKGLAAAPPSTRLERPVPAPGPAPAPETTAEGGVLPGETFIELIQGLPSDLLHRALTHSSWVGERTGSYERLEFLGDSVLGLAISSALYSRFPEREEGGLARLKAFVVSRASCVQVAERVGLADLVLAHAPASERKRREAVRSRSMLGDVLEALIGAVYVNYGFDRARPAIIEVFEDQIQYAATAHVDHKTALQELLAPRGLQPVYRLVEETGPAHARTFASEVVVDGQVRGRGMGTTIKMSEQAAAQEALASLGSSARSAPAVEADPAVGGPDPRQAPASLEALGGLDD